MNKLLTKLSTPFILAFLFTLPVPSIADNPANVPPPPDIDSAQPPSVPATDNATVPVLPPTGDLVTPPEAPPLPASNQPDNTTANSVVPPPPPSDKPASTTTDSVVPPPPPSNQTDNTTANTVAPPPPPSDQPNTVAPVAPPPPEVKVEKTEPVPTAVKVTAKAPESAPKKTEIIAKVVEKPQPAPPAQTVAASIPSAVPGPPLEKILTAYKYAYQLYAARQYDKAKDIFKKITLVTEQPALKANSLYYFSQCAFRTEDYLGCVKALKLLAQKEPDCAAVRKGYVSRFCVFLIDQAANLQTNWDYFRYKIDTDEKGNPVWRESIPPGPKIKRINFRLAFGLYHVLHSIQPNSPEDAAAKQKLDHMLTAPITMIWVDEKAPETKYGHPGDFFSVFSTNEKKHFSKVICQRMFYDFETEYFYKFLDMHDDIRNQKPRFVAVNRLPQKYGQSSSANEPPAPQNINESLQLPGDNSQAPAPPAATANAPSSITALSTEEDPATILNLGNLLHVAGYYPWLDSYSNTIETAPTDLNL